MRTAIFAGALIIARAIRPIENPLTALGILILLMVFVVVDSIDVFVLLMGRKPK